MCVLYLLGSGTESQIHPEPTGHVAQAVSNLFPAEPARLQLLVGAAIQVHIKIHGDGQVAQIVLLGLLIEKVFRRVEIAGLDALVQCKPQSVRLCVGLQTGGGVVGLLLAQHQTHDGFGQYVGIPGHIIVLQHGVMLLSVPFMGLSQRKTFRPSLDVGEKWWYS